MFALMLKWGFVLAAIVAVVYALSTEQIRKPIFAFIRKHYIQILIVIVAFIAILTFSQLGT